MRDEPAVAEIEIGVDEPPASSGSLATQLRDGTRRDSLGVLQGSDDLTFGWIEAAHEGSGGRILVLDTQAEEVRVFGPEHDLLQVLGGSGAGPGEYRNPVEMTVTPSGEVAVFDGVGLVHMYEVRGDSLSLAGAVDVGMTVYDGCLLNDLIVIHGLVLENPYVLHTFRRGGERVKSFGELYRTANLSVREQLANASITCVPDANEVIVAPVLLPEVRAFSGDGEPLWWSRVVGARAIDYRESRDGRTSATIGPEGYHGTIELESDGRRTVIWQLALVTRDSRREGGLAGIETVMLDARSGRGEYLGSQIPRLQGLTERRALLSVPDPFPRLVVASLREQG